MLNWALIKHPLNWVTVTLMVIIGMIALNLEDGKTAWQRPLPPPAYLMDWGAAVSPIVYGDKVFFNQDDDLSPTLFALDAATGQRDVMERATVALLDYVDLRFDERIYVRPQTVGRRRGE